MRSAKVHLILKIGFLFRDLYESTFNSNFKLCNNKKSTDADLNQTICNCFNSKKLVIKDGSCFLSRLSFSLSLYLSASLSVFLSVCLVLKLKQKQLFIFLICPFSLIWPYTIHAGFYRRQVKKNLQTIISKLFAQNERLTSPFETCIHNFRIFSTFQKNKTQWL
jgi:hypothetical protein